MIVENGTNVKFVTGTKKGLTGKIVGNFKFNGHIHYGVKLDNGIGHSGTIYDSKCYPTDGTKTYWNGSFESVAENLLEIIFEPKCGDEVEVSSSEKDWFRRIFIAKASENQIMCVSIHDNHIYQNNITEIPFNVYTWRFMRPIQKPKVIEVTLKEIAKLKNVEVSQIRIKE